MGSKKDKKRNPVGAKSTEETAGIGIRPPVKPAVPTSHNAADLLSNALAGLDAIAQDAVSLDTQPTGSKRPHSDSLSTLALPHYEALHRLVTQHGAQLAPSLHAIIRRVLPALAAPAMSSAAGWELAAALSTCYAAGAARLLSDLLDLLLAAPVPFLIGSGPAQGLSHEDAVRYVTAVDEMLIASGAFVATGTMQRVGMRFAEEVVVQGILNESRDVPQILHAPCMSLLTTLLLISRPLPPLVAACAARTVRELHGRADDVVMRAVRRLAATLHAVRHPYAVPFYVPPQDIVERPTRRVTENGEEAVTVSKESQTETREAETVAAAMESGSHAEGRMIGVMPTRVLSIMEESTDVSLKSVNTATKVKVAVEAPRQIPKMAPLTPVAPVVPHNDNESDEDALPDIDIED